MLEALEIKGLRGIAEAKLETLAPLTILVGPNGSAKSTVLEAVGVACAGNDAVSAADALIQREWLGLSGLGHVMPSGQASVRAAWTVKAPQPLAWYTSTLRLTLAEGNPPTAVISLQLHDSRGHLLQGNQPSARVDDDGNFQVHLGPRPLSKFELIHAFVDRPAGAAQRFSKPRFSSALREALGQLKLSPLYDDVFANIQALRPNLVSIESVPVGDRDEPFMFEKTPAGRVGYPVAYAGDGFRRTLLLAAGFAAAEKGVVAIDEPDAFAHPTMFERLAGLIRRSVEQGTQVIYATHSMEFVGATLRAFQDRLDALAVFGLQLVDGKLDAVRIPGADAERRVHELGHDLRL